MTTFDCFDNVLEKLQRDLHWSAYCYRSINEEFLSILKKISESGRNDSTSVDLITSYQSTCEKEIEELCKVIDEFDDTELENKIRLLEMYLSSKMID